MCEWLINRQYISVVCRENETVLPEYLMNNKYNSTSIDLSKKSTLIVVECEHDFFCKLKNVFVAVTISVPCT